MRVDNIPKGVVELTNRHTAAVGFEYSMPYAGGVVFWLGDKVMYAIDGTVQWVLSAEEMEHWGDEAIQGVPKEQWHDLFNGPDAPTVIPGVTEIGERLKNLRTA